eukprot:GHVT01030540.1.p1 GENE.GHVT01030540.1~~GHVT01030540.1.p1  ORF type:complete len:184 (-),score=39.13 GHVT01030540.1:189-740(-)
MSESRQQSQGTRVDLDALALRGEEVLDKILSTEIPQVQEERAAVSEDIAELETLRRNIDMLRKRKQNSLNTLVDVGGDTYMQATVSDCSMIFIDVGSKFFLQLTLDEAAHFLVKKKKILLTRLELAIDQTARVKAHAHLLKEAVAATSTRFGGERGTQAEISRRSNWKQSDGFNARATPAQDS